MIGIVIDRLLTDKDLRIRFLLDRFETLAELGLRGFELTADEFDVFIQTDPRVWFWSSDVAADRVH
jgi:hypothetical protein